MAFTDPLFYNLFPFPTFTFLAISKFNVAVVLHNAFGGRSLGSINVVKVVWEGGGAGISVTLSDSVLMEGSPYF